MHVVGSGENGTLTLTSIPFLKHITFFSVFPPPTSIEYQEGKKMEHIFTLV
jgi:hypothetical protein